MQAVLVFMIFEELHSISQTELDFFQQSHLRRTSPSPRSSEPGSVSARFSDLDRIHAVKRQARVVLALKERLESSPRDSWQVQAAPEDSHHCIRFALAAWGCMSNGRALSR